METINICGISVKVERPGTNFHHRISRAEAVRLLKMERRGVDLPFCIMCKEYGDDSDWVGLTAEDLDGDESGGMDADWKTLEIME